MMKKNAFILFGLASVLLCACEKDPDKEGFKNLWKNSPWNLSSIKVTYFENFDSETPIRDTTVYDYGSFEFENTAHDFYYEGSGSYYQNNIDWDFAYNLGSVNENLNLRILFLIPNLDLTLSYPNEGGKSLVLESLEKSYWAPYNGNPHVLPFITEPGYYSYELHLNSAQ